VSTSSFAKQRAETLMTIAVTLGELTQSIELCPQIPEYLTQSLGLEPLTLSVIHEPAGGEASLFLFGASSSVAAEIADGSLRQTLMEIHQETRSPTVGESPTMRSAFELEQEKLQDFPRSTIFAQRIDAEYRLLLVVHQRATSEALSSATLEQLEMVAQLLAKLMGCLVTWAGPTSRPAVFGSNFERITPREWAVLRAMESDLGEKQLADLLQLSPHTLHSHVKSLYRRFGVQGRLSVIKRLEQTRRAWRLAKINERTNSTPAEQEAPIAAAS
jgi:DNA-binding CsgD family transcriptional regulator